MPSKPVVQNTCERCTRVWYTAKAAEVKLELSAELGHTQLSVKYGCLCDGCAKTVESLLKSIAKEFKPRAPRAKKKPDEKPTSAGQGNPQPADTAITKDGAPSSAPAADASALASAAPVSLAASSSAAGGQRPSPPAGAVQRPR